jgi:hypothetical protein
LELLILAISERLQKSILNKLQGYITTDQRDELENLTEMEYDNVISEDELEDFYAQALSQCCTYCYLVNFPTETIEGTVVMNRQFEQAVILWTAGLIWRKYDIRANDNVEEVGNYVISYGDQLIIDAKKQLEPFIYKSVAFW